MSEIGEIAKRAAMRVREAFHPHWQNNVNLDVVFQQAIDEATAAIAAPLEVVGTAREIIQEFKAQTGEEGETEA